MNELILSVTAGLIDECKVEVDKDESLESALQIFINSINFVVSQPPNSNYIDCS